MFYEFLFVSLYTLLGITTWMLIWTAIMDLLVARDSSKEVTLIKRFRIRRKLGSHNYYSLPEGFA